MAPVHGRTLSSSHTIPRNATWLDRAFEAGFRDYGIIDRDPILLTIAPQAKVREIIGKMRADIDTQRTHAQQGGLLDIDALLRPVK